LTKLDQIISDNLSKDWSINRLSKTEISVLRLATFELCFQKKFNKVTIINEYISIIEAFGGNADFANGILENISKLNK
jgi:N utilization substance protein B